jgi:hypothetical protein
VQRDPVLVQVLLPLGREPTLAEEVHHLPHRLISG